MSYLKTGGVLVSWASFFVLAWMLVLGMVEDLIFGVIMLFVFLLIAGLISNWRPERGHGEDDAMREMLDRAADDLDNVDRL